MGQCNTFQNFGWFLFFWFQFPILVAEYYLYRSLLPKLNIQIPLIIRRLVTTFIVMTTAGYFFVDPAREVSNLFL